MPVITGRSTDASAPRAVEATGGHSASARGAVNLPGPDAG